MIPTAAITKYFISKIENLNKTEINYENSEIIKNLISESKLSDIFGHESEIFQKEKWRNLSEEEDV